MRKFKNDCLVVGYFPSNPLFQSNGETSKGQNVLKLLQEHYSSVISLSTEGARKRPIRFFFKLFFAERSSYNIIVVVSINGILKILPFCRRFMRRNQRLVYLMVGVGPFNLIWRRFPECQCFRDFAKNETLWRIQPSSAFSKALSKCDWVGLETKSLETMSCKVLGITNTFIFPNFRDVVFLPPKKKYLNKPLRFVFFSRVVKSKGIEDLIGACLKLNQDGFSFIIDVYGFADSSYLSFLSTLFPFNMKYKGVSKNDQIEVLSDYDCLVFPTRDSEGTPGVVVEALIAGVPIISSDFAFASDIFKNGEGALIYTFQNADGLYESMKKALLSPTLVFDLRKKAIESSKQFSSSLAIQKLSERLSGKSYS